MISLKTLAGGVAIAGSLALAPLALGSGVANAEPSPVPPHFTSTQDGAAPTVGTSSPYAAYGSSAICATPGLYFVNICS